MNLIEKALSQLGNSEQPKGSNWGPSVKKYLNSVGINFPASWCMAFVYWCARDTSNDTGNPNPLIKTGGVLNQWRKIDAKYKHSSPAAGDIFIMDFGKGLGHTGIVEKVVGDTIHTIEGNSNDEGSREGFEVCRRTRKISSCVGFIRTGL